MILGQLGHHISNTILLKGTLSLVVAPCLPRHSPYWRGAPYNLYLFKHFNSWKFLILYQNLYNFITFLLNVSFKFFKSYIFLWIRLDFESYFIKLICIFYYISLHSSVHIVLHLSSKRFLSLWCALSFLKLLMIHIIR